MCICVCLVVYNNVLIVIVLAIFLEDKDNPPEKMEIVIDKDIFIASVSIQ